MSVTVLDECPNAAAMVSFGMSSEAAMVAQVWRAQYAESEGNSGCIIFFPPLPMRSICPIFFNPIFIQWVKSL